MTKKTSTKRNKNQESNLEQSNNLGFLSLLPTNQKKDVLNCYLMQIHWANLTDYFDQALILPAKYCKNRIEPDLQTRKPDFLVLTKNCYIDDITHETCFIELILTENELQNSIQLADNNIIFISNPLPITRIKNIYCNNAEVKEKLLNFVKTGSISYIPSTLFDSIKPDLTQKTTDLLFESTQNEDYSNQISKFDKVLGLFAFIKNTQIYYSSQTNLYSNYTIHYFKALSAINVSVKNTIQLKEDDGHFKMFKKFLMLESFDTESKKELINSIYANENFNKDFLNVFVSKFENELEPQDKEILKIAIKKFSDPLEKRSSLHELYKLKSKIFYQIALLTLYGNRDSDDKDILKNSIIPDIYYEQAEAIFALFGLYYGYKRMRASEKIYQESIFTQKFGDELNIKFRLDSKLDYITIESVYQFAFNNNYKNEEFDYLIYPENFKKEFSFINSKFSSDFKIDTQNIFDVTFFIIKKTNQIEIIEQKIKSLPNEITDKNFIYIFIRRYLDKTDIVRLYDNKPTIKKDEFISTIRNSKTFDFDFLISCIDNDIKFPINKLMK